MKKYAEYKDSGIEWIGDIPIHWNLIRLKYLCKSKLMYGANESADFEDPSQPRYIRITDFGDDGKLKDETFKSLPYEKAESYLLEDGDVLFARSGATVGKTFQFKNYNGLACFAGYLIKASPNEEMMLSDFIYFYTKSRVYENWKNSIFNQATIQNIGADKYNDLLISLPSIQEQRSIATYLNDKTSQIDTLIEKKRQMIELLKEERTAIINQAVTKGINPDAEMKDSGIEWLGEVPKHWDVKKIKHVSTKIGSGITPKGGADVYQTSGIPLLRSQNVHFTGLKLEDVAYITQEIHDSMSNSEVFDGDVLLNITGASIGRCYYAKKIILPANVNQHVCIIRPNGYIITEYLYLVLSSFLGQFQIEHCQTGANREGLNFEQLKNFTIPLPPIFEQKKIIGNTYAHLNKIDKTIALTEKEISLIEEYQTVLINEAVTGKIDIRE